MIQQLTSKQASVVEKIVREAVSRRGSFTFRIDQFAVDEGNGGAMKIAKAPELPPSQITSDKKL